MDGEAVQHPAEDAYLHYSTYLVSLNLLEASANEDGDGYTYKIGL